MRDRPSGAALLDIARQALLDGVAPSLRGKARYTALMVARAIGIAARELEQAEDSRRAWDVVLGGIERPEDASLDAGMQQLVDAIRAGRHDANPALHAALAATAEIAAGIARPGKPAA